MNEIISYHPFKAVYTSYDGYDVSISFRCPFCGSSSCVRSVNSTSNHFFEGNYRCMICRKGSFDGEPFYYASSCFIKTKHPIYEQLSLF